MWQLTKPRNPQGDYLGWSGPVWILTKPQGPQGELLGKEGSHVAAG